MEIYLELLLFFLPWVFFIGFALMAKKLIHLAKKRKGLALAFGALVQLFLPDPQVEKTIEMMVVSRRKQDGVEKDESDLD